MSNLYTQSPEVTFYVVTVPFKNDKMLHVQQKVTTFILCKKIYDRVVHNAYE